MTAAAAAAIAGLNAIASYTQQALQQEQCTLPNLWGRFSELGPQCARWLSRLIPANSQNSGSTLDMASASCAEMA
eukprot:14363-Heterococcus_DN1.PRE.1